MADSSLDDFFAKKDKSKKKTKTKVASSSDVDDGSKAVKKEKKKKDKDKQNTGGGSLNALSNVKEDEEWKDFEEEKEVDYSGLRIQNMQIAKGDQERDAADAEDEGEDEDGENRERKAGASGPWNKSNEPAAAAPAPPPASETPEPPVKEEAPTPKAPAKYVPPGARLAAASTTPSFPSRRKKEAPNLQSEEDFPTLGGGPGLGGRPYNQQYSSSGSSDLIDNPAQRKGVNLTLENKFSALQD